MLSGHWFQIAAAVVVFLTGIGGGMLAMRPSATAEAEAEGKVRRLGAAGAGGIFLGAGLIHMLGGSGSAFATQLPQVQFPLAYLIAAVGFVGVLGIERVLFRSHSPGDGRYAWILLLVLSIHSLISGMALGIEDTVVVGTTIAIALIAHKGAAAFSLVIGMTKSSIPRARMWRLLVLFCLVTPFGILVGRSLNTLLANRSGELTEAVIDALCAGSFLYIAAIDIIDEEFKPGEESHLLRFGALLGGIGLMAVIALYA